MIKRLTAYKDILNETITPETMERAIKDVIRDGPEIPKPEIIIRETAKYFSLKEEDLRGQNRSKNLLIHIVDLLVIRVFVGMSISFFFRGN